MQLKLGIRPFVFIILLLTGVWIGDAGAVMIDFDGFAEGRVIDDEFSLFLTISAMDTGKNSRPAVIFNRNTDRDLEDIDLMAPWFDGDIADEDLGNLLVIHDDQRPDLDAMGNIAHPDDEGDRPSGSIFLFFSSAKIAWV
jgi:hypothetical protein